MVKVCDSVSTGNHKYKKKTTFYDGTGWREGQIMMLPEVSYLRSTGINGQQKPVTNTLDKGD